MSVKFRGMTSSTDRASGLNTKDGVDEEAKMEYDQYDGRNRDGEEGYGRIEVVEFLSDDVQNTRNLEKAVPNDVNDEDPTPENGTKESCKKQIHMKVAHDAPWISRMWEVIATFWPLGFLAFGGPQAHIAILRDHLVVQRDWLDEDQFQELFAIGQGLPGPSSTQLVIACAIARAGPAGGLVAFLLWALPGAAVLTGAGILIDNFVDPNVAPWYLIGLPPAALSIVFFAFYLFAAKLNKLGVVLALVTCLVAILLDNDERISPTASQWVFPLCIGTGGLVTYLDSKRSKPFGEYSSPMKGWDQQDDETIKRIGIPVWVGVVVFACWLAVLIGAIVLKEVAGIQNVYLDIFEVMYRIGSIIYGGGQVVLPMLQEEVVGTLEDPKWMTDDQFLQGLGLATSMPGPLFNFAAYLGSVYQRVPGAIVAWLGLFSPGFVLIIAAMPFWAKLRHNRIFRSVLIGVNAAAVGLVGAACVILWETAIITASDAMIFATALTLHVSFSVAAPFCIIVGFVAGAIMHPDALDIGQVPYCINGGFVRQV